MVCPLGTISGTQTSTTYPKGPWHKLLAKKLQFQRHCRGMGFFDIKRWGIWPRVIGEARLGIYRNEQTGSELLQTVQLGVSQAVLVLGASEKLPISSGLSVHKTHHFRKRLQKEITSNPSHLLFLRVPPVSTDLVIKKEIECSEHTVSSIHRNLWEMYFKLRKYNHRKLQFKLLVG